MDFKIISSTKGTAIIESENNKSYLAITTGLNSKSFKGINTSQFHSLPGLLIDKETITNWKLDGTTEIDGIVYYYGPLLSGSTLADIQIDQFILLELAQAFKLIKDKDVYENKFSLNSIFRTDDGKILFFPPYLSGSFFFLFSARYFLLNLNFLLKEFYFQVQFLSMIKRYQSILQWILHL